MADEPRDIVLEQLRFIRADIANIKDDVTAMRDELRVQGAMIIRLENAVGRIERRLRILEDALGMARLATAGGVNSGDSAQRML